MLMTSSRKVTKEAWLVITVSCDAFSLSDNPEFCDRVLRVLSSQDDPEFPTTKRFRAS